MFPLDGSGREVCLACAELLYTVPPAVLLAAVVAVTGGALTLCFGLLYILAPVPRKASQAECCYRSVAADGSISQPTPLPSWGDSVRRDGRAGKPPVSIGQEAEVYMSVVVPAFNEEARLPGMLKEAVAYLEECCEGDRIEEGQADAVGEKVDAGAAGGTTAPGVRKRGRALDAAIATSKPSASDARGWEILIVSDGSSDATVATALEFAKQYQESRRLRRPSESPDAALARIRVVALEKNRGKGGAVTHGMRHIRGKYVVFADADGASDFGDLGKLVAACEAVTDSWGRGVAVGSRAHLVGSEAVVKRSKLRNFLMHSFHLILRLLTPPVTAAIKDTQCGFKLFSRGSLPFIVPFMHSEGWIFDVEMLMLAEFADIGVAEVPVGWHEVTGSKLNIIWDSLGMAYGLALLRAAWGFGVYRRSY